jgi:hypothetical protein
MKWLRFLVLVFGLLLAAATVHGSEGVDDILDLQWAAVDGDVILAFVENSDIPYNLTADDIQQLEDAGVPSVVIVAMLDHRKQLRREQPEQYSTPIAATTTLATAAPTVYKREEVFAPAPGQANLSLFYEALAPYGTWSRDTESGWVWEPTDGVRNANWRPYANDGHWIWTDHGWYWQSDAPYAWATFHYGRWGRNSSRRWVWVPDNVWGPAWVDWRQSDEHYGWAPLPIGSRYEAGLGFSLRGQHIGFEFHSILSERDYTFVPSTRFLDLNVGLFFEPERRRHDVYQRTRSVNNTYIYNDNRIINNGVTINVVERATNRKIERITVVDANIAKGQPIRGERREGNKIVTYRPKVANEAPFQPPVMAAHQKAMVRRANAAATAESRIADAADRKSTEQNARRRIVEEKAQRSGKKADAMELQRDTNKDAAAERDAANRAAAARRKAAAETSRELKQNTLEERRDAVRDAAAERDAANKAAAAQHKAAAETSRELKQNTLEERRDAVRDAANTQKAEAEAVRKANQ